MSGDVEIWQRNDGTIYRKIHDQWFYLSPLFGEWLPVFDHAPSQEDMKPYPRNLDVPTVILNSDRQFT